jgi:hypothetical protein
LGRTGHDPRALPEAGVVDTMGLRHPADLVGYGADHQVRESRRRGERSGGRHSLEEERPTRIPPGLEGGLLRYRLRDLPSWEDAMKGILVFGSGGPLLLLSSYPTIDDPELVEKLRAKGLEKYIAYEVPIERCRDIYGRRYRENLRNLETSDDMRVLDFDGHHIFLHFSLRSLGTPYVIEGEGDAAA